MILFSDRATTRARLVVLRRAVDEAYLRHAMAIDTLAPRANTIALDTASRYTLTTGTAFQPGNPYAFQTGFQRLAQYADTPARALVTDGFGRPCTLQTMRLIAGKYATYFTTQYESDANRDIAIDYFASAPPGSSNPTLWDSASPIGNSANGNGPGFAFPDPLPAGATATGTLTGPSICDMQPVTDIAFAHTLGLPTTDKTSAWGYELGVGNGPHSGGSERYGDDRDPRSANGALTSPPYGPHRRVGAGGTLVTVPVIGAY